MRVTIDRFTLCVMCGGFFAAGGLFGLALGVLAAS